MIDIHSHILPNIDDGSRSLEETITMIEEAKKVGFTDIICTSHYMSGVYTTDTMIREELINDINQIMNLEINLYIGAEIYICPELKELLAENVVTTLNNTRYVLIELPMNDEILYLNELILAIKNMNLIPIIAHPERYIYFQDDPNKMIEYIENGVLFQSNYGSILGKYGTKVQKTIKKILKHNFIHFLGTDSHRCNSIYRNIPEAVEKIKKIVGNEKFEELSERNPKKLLNNEEIFADIPVKIKRLFG